MMMMQLENRFAEKMEKSPGYGNKLKIKKVQ